MLNMLEVKCWRVLKVVKEFEVRRESLGSPGGADIRWRKWEPETRNDGFNLVGSCVSKRHFRGDTLRPVQFVCLMIFSCQHWSLLLASLCGIRCKDAVNYSRESHTIWRLHSARVWKPSFFRLFSIASFHFPPLVLFFRWLCSIAYFFVLQSFGSFPFQQNDTNLVKDKERKGTKWTQEWKIKMQSKANRMKPNTVK